MVAVDRGAYSVRYLYLKESTLGFLEEKECREADENCRMDRCFDICNYCCHVNPDVLFRGVHDSDFFHGENNARRGLSVREQGGLRT